MNKYLIRGLVATATSLVLAVASTSCTNDLDQQPKYELTPDKVYVDLNGYRQVLAKLYGGFALTGQIGPANPTANGGDLNGIDEGTSDYLRQYWSAQELTTDEATVVWNDLGIRDWHNMNWDSSNPLIRGLYSRIYFEIATCNQFIRESSDEKLAARLSGNDVATVKRYRAEARFLRAVSYMHVIDLYGNGPFVTETDAVGFTSPPYSTRQQLFTYVESELTALAADPDFAEPRTNEYARVDKAAAWAMLSRLYLNAQVYTGTARYADAATQAKKVIDAGYSLVTAAAGSVASPYGRLFLADNNTAPARNEIIWPVAFDVNNTQSYGGTTFLVNGATGSSAAWQARVGQSTGWTGLRTTRNLFNLFQNPGGGLVSDTTLDTRGRFWTRKNDNSARSLEIGDLYDFEQGYGVVKFRNVNSAGAAQGAGLNFSSVDFPMIRLAEVMLTYAEAAIRGGGDRALALRYVNQLRARAFNNQPGSAITDAQLTDRFILDERGRELFWEGYRRTDLIRYNRFVESSYLWPWKGGVAAGRAVEPFRVLFPIPAADLSVNRNLRQNDGY
ncbi:RagB/SusD family nutrient uptake outer membrane protein [Hymenobacter sp.]|jgi:hypothetical protein|uniref:RagB/SusD family nutrient uptake outer membrane protein n=1 Tax=Hymenobacter sp. TaxID=1898978 RepID=UPI002EDA3068